MNHTGDGSKEDMAEDRTKLAEDRTVLANERTLLSWMGGGMGSLGLAVGLQAVFGETQPTWIAKATASIFVLLAIVLALIGYRKTVATDKRLSTHTASSVRNINLLWVISIFCLGAISICAILWML